MPSTNSFCNCATNCAVNTLPALAVNQTCASTSDLKKSQISYIVFLPTGATPPASWTNAANWASVLDNTDTTSTKAKIFSVTGGITSPTITRVDFPLGKSAISSREYTMTLVRQKLDQTDYDFGLALQCGGDFDFWYGSLGNLFYGGQSGIAPSEINVSFPKGSGKTDVDQMLIEIKFLACGDPPRTVLSLL